MTRRFAPVALFLLLALLLALGLMREPGSARELPSPLVGKAAPPFTLARLDDPARTLSPEDLRGRVWLLNVWASWCTTCLQEHPQMLALAQEQRLLLIGLNYKDQAADAQRWLARHGNPYALSLSDADGRVGIDYGVYGVPETFVVDQQGVVRHKHTGALTPQALRERILPLVRGLGG